MVECGSVHDTLLSASLLPLSGLSLSPLSRPDTLILVVILLLLVRSERVKSDYLNLQRWVKNAFFNQLKPLEVAVTLSHCYTYYILTYLLLSHGHIGPELSQWVPQTRWKSEDLNCIVLRLVTRSWDILSHNRCSDHHTVLSFKWGPRSFKQLSIKAP